MSLSPSPSERTEAVVVTERSQAGRPQRIMSSYCAPPKMSGVGCLTGNCPALPYRPSSESKALAFVLNYKGGDVPPRAPQLTFPPSHSALHLSTINSTQYSSILPQPQDPSPTRRHMSLNVPVRLWNKSPTGSTEFARSLILRASAPQKRRQQRTDEGYSAPSLPRRSGATAHSLSHAYVLLPPAYGPHGHLRQLEELFR